MLAWWTGSIALLADAFNNGADILSSVIIAGSCRWSRAPSDRDHPFGHGRMEIVAALVLSLFLIGVALQVAMSGLRRLLQPEPVRLGTGAWITVVITVVVKGLLAAFARWAARLSNSQVLEADAWNHTFDVLATSLVLLAMAGARWGWYRLDGWAAVMVAGFIAATGVRYTRAAVSQLIGEAPSPEEVARIRALAASVPGVRGVHDVVVHRYGDARLISLHIEVDAQMSVLDAHVVCEQAEQRVAEALNAKVVAHVDPVDRSHPQYEAAAASLQAYVKAHEEVAGFHDLRLSGQQGQTDLAVDIVLKQPHSHGAAVGDVEVLRKRLREYLQQEVPGLRRLDVGFEVEHSAEHENRQTYRTIGGNG